MASYLKSKIYSKKVWRDWLLDEPKYFWLVPQTKDAFKGKTLAMCLKSYARSVGLKDDQIVLEIKTKNEFNFEGR